MTTGSGRHGVQRRWLCGLALALALPTGAALADTVMPVLLPAVQDALTGIAVRLPGGRERTLTITELESLGTWRLRTISPLNEGEIVVEGPLLRDVLAHVGLDRTRSILVRSMDGYAMTIPTGDWRDYPVILATRLGGKLLGRRHMGPTRIVYPLLDYPELSSPDHRARWVWLIASIEAVE